MSVFLSNLDDFIAPSQACINPFVLNRKLDIDVKPGPSKIVLQSDFSSSEYERPKQPSIIQPDLIKSKASTSLKGQKVAAVSLNDCLACSGCVTSAETVLIQEQSYQKLLDRISDDRKRNGVVIVCLSPQSVASMATFIGISSSDIFLRLAAALKLLGVDYVLDTSAAGDVALIEAREEFMLRHRNGRSTLWEKPPHSVAASSTTAYFIPSEGLSNKAGNGGFMESSDRSSATDNLVHIGAPTNIDQALPMLASQCPGWVCYAEKTQPQSLPFISHTKSPQQIMGTILKQIIFKSATSSSAQPDEMKQNLSNNYIDVKSTADSLLTSNIHCSNRDIILTKYSQVSEVKSVYVVSVQPCFDKKLESSRKDFYHSDTDCQEVDLVLSTTELWSLLEERASSYFSSKHHAISDVNINAYTDSSNADAMDTNDDVPQDVSVSHYLLHHIIPDDPNGRDSLERMFRCSSADGKAFVSSVDSNGSSGGYLEHIFRHAAEKLCGVNLWGKPLVYTPGRNIDVCEVTLCNQIPPSDSNTDTVTDVSDKVKSTTLKFGKAYGFRNIQSLMLKLKQGKCDLDFVEIMACPSGCVNGGGQLKEERDQAQAQIQGERIRELSSVTAARVKAVELTFSGAEYRRPEDAPLVKYLYSSVSSVSSVARSQSQSKMKISTACHTTDGPEDNPIPEKLTEKLADDIAEELKIVINSSVTLDPQIPEGGVLGLPLGPRSMSLLHTRYHSVPKLELIAPLAAKW